MARKQNSDHELVASGAAPARRRLSKHNRTPVRTNQAPPAQSVPETTDQQTAPQPTREQVAQLAYSYWEARGFQGGRPEDDWIRAEQELLSPR